MNKRSPKESDDKNESSEGRQKIYDQQISPMLFGSVEGALVDVELTSAEEVLFSKIFEEHSARSMKRSDDWVAKREEEYEDWDRYIGSQCAKLAKMVSQAANAGDKTLAEKLEREWRGWILVQRLGINRARETGLGKMAFLHIYQQRQAIEKEMAKILEKHNEKKR